MKTFIYNLPVWKWYVIRYILVKMRINTLKLKIQLKKSHEKMFNLYIYLPLISSSYILIWLKYYFKVHQLITNLI